MRHRIFIAINLPEDIKKKLLDFQKKWDFLPVRWTKKDSLHLTLVFIGYVTDEQMFEVCQITKQMAQKHQPFFIEFEKILYGPPNKTPRMIWMEGKASEELSKIKNELENALVSSGQLGSFRAERRPLSPHITLARMKMDQWHALQKKPEIEQDFKLNAVVNNIDVMESELKRDGAEYTILESCPLGKNL